MFTFKSIKALMAIGVMAAAGAGGAWGQVKPPFFDSVYFGNGVGAQTLKLSNAATFPTTTKTFVISNTTK